MREEKALKQVGSLVLGIAIAFTASHSVAAPVVVSGQVAGRNGEPAVVFNSKLNQFLVVWSNTTDHKIYSRVVRPGGTFGGNPVAVSKKIEAGEEAAAAFNSKDNEYLVVWGTNTTGGYSDTMYLQRISAQGSLRGGTIKLAGESKKLNWHPSVAYSATDKTYFVVWSREGLMTADGGNYQPASDGIYGQFVGADGHPLGTPSLIQKMAYQVKDGKLWHLGYQRMALQWQASTERYGLAANHIVSAESAENQKNQSVDFLSINSNGQLLKSPVKMNSVGVGSDSVSVSLAENTSTGKWLTSWESLAKQGNAEPGRIYSRAATGAGTASGSVKATFDNKQQAGRPALAFNPDKQNFLVVFYADTFFEGGTNFDVLGQFVSGDGVNSGSQVQIAATEVAEAEEAVVYNPQQKNFFVAYTEVTSKDENRILGTFVTAP